MQRETTIQKLLTMAYESGAEVMVQLKVGCSHAFQGRVQSIASDGFSLFHSGKAGGVLWAFQLEDVATCGLVVELPSEIETLQCSAQDTKQPDLLQQKHQDFEK